MALIKLKYVYPQRNKGRKDQRLRDVCRIPGIKAFCLPGVRGSEEYLRAYHEALARAPTALEIGAERTVPGTINALAINYCNSAAWTNLPPDTRKNRRPIIERFRERNDSKHVAGLRPHNIEAALKEITAGPATKDYWLRTIRALLRSGIPSMIKDDPTAGIKVHRPKTEGHWTWEPAEIAQYRAHHPLGTEARLVLEFALQTYSRRGEVVRLGPQHVHRGSKGSRSPASRAAATSTSR
jgi:hypothetical protein